MTRPRAFTIVELLVVISVIMLLIALLLPALGKARGIARQMMCGSNMRQLIVAVQVFSNDDDERFPPMQRIVDGVEYSWRGLLYPYTSQNPNAFDCPAEPLQRYADGAFDDLGNPTANETFIWSGIGAVNVHWNQGDQFRPAFGRWDPRYPQYGTGRAPVCRWGDVRSPGEMIVFGDGNSSYDIYDKLYYFSEDAFWIYKGSAVGASGYNRAIVPTMGFLPEQGLERHGDEFDANYVFADGSGQLLDANTIPCNDATCWWDAQLDPH